VIGLFLLQAASANLALARAHERWERPDVHQRAA
jgi:hypothetical protein